MRSKILQDILDSIKPSDKPKEREKYSLAFQLGFYVGEMVILTKLPTLSIDLLRTSTVIPVTCAEGDKYRSLSDKWFNAPKDSKEREEYWDEEKAYYKILKDKYLPKSFYYHCNVLNLEDKDIEDFKEGLIASLWDSDCCSYSLKKEDITIEEKDGTNFITFVLK